MLSLFENKEAPIKWDDSQYYLPLPRHRRAMIFRLLKKLDFKNCLDAGCAQHYLLSDITQYFKIKGYGCDISAKIIAANSERAPDCIFKQIDIEKETWPNQQFDLVISSEVIEHIPDWQSAVKHLANMSQKYLMITVPSGQKRPIDEIVGHYRHYQGPELITEIEKHHFNCIQVVRHGFPMHSLYKRIINNLNPEKLYQSFHSGQKYSLKQKLLAHVLYWLFFINRLFKTGDQLIVLAQRIQ